MFSKLCLFFRLLKTWSSDSSVAQMRENQIHAFKRKGVEPQQTERLHVSQTSIWPAIPAARCSAVISACVWRNMHVTQPASASWRPTLSLKLLIFPPSSPCRPYSAHAVLLGAHHSFTVFWASAVPLPAPAATGNGPDSLGLECSCVYVCVGGEMVGNLSLVYTLHVTL